MLLAEIPDLTSWARKALDSKGWATLEDILAQPDEVLLEVQGVGENTVRKLRELGTSLKADVFADAFFKEAEHMARTILFTLVAGSKKALEQYAIDAWGLTTEFYREADRFAARQA